MEFLDPQLKANEILEQIRSNPNSKGLKRQEIKSIAIEVAGSMITNRKQTKYDIALSNYWKQVKQVLINLKS
jgi:uncharacterized protein YjbK